MTLANAATAAAVASWLTNPLDLAKLRLQVRWGSVWSALCFFRRARVGNKGVAFPDRPLLIFRPSFSGLHDDRGTTGGAEKCLECYICGL